jgi:antitoxin (DNA-binding transcriptional repressor) of toxin-antitoxin stability system
MISVGVRDLKNQLSQYLQYVKHGERVLITEHNRIIAEISLPREGQKEHSVEEALERLAASGKLQKAKRNISVASSDGGTPSVDWISVYRENRDRD